MDVLTLTAPGASMDKETHVCGAGEGGVKREGRKRKTQRYRGIREGRRKERGKGETDRDTETSLWGGVERDTQIQRARDRNRETDTETQKHTYTHTPTAQCWCYWLCRRLAVRIEPGDPLRCHSDI